MAIDEAGSQREEVVSLEKQIEELSRLVPDDSTAQELERLQRRLEKLRREVFARLTPWQKVQIARHPQRPHFLDYVGLLFEDFSELHGDRRFEDDSALVAGMALYHGSPCLVLGTTRGR